MKKDTADVITIKDPDMEKAPSTIQVVPFKSYAFLKGENLFHLWSERDAMIEKRQLEKGSM